MADYHRKHNHRASSSAFAWGTQVHTKYKSGCLRKILVQSTGYSTDIDEKYKIVGELNEQRHEKRLEGLDVIVQREVPFVEVLDPETGVTMTGHADFVISDPATGKPTEVHELKSVQSKNTRRDVIKSGHYVVENLAQLVTYMAAFGVSSGKLIYTYYEPIAGKDGKIEYVPMDEKIFAVEVDEFGKIFVDSKPSQYTVYDVFAHQILAAKVIAKKIVGCRPLGWDAVFGSPCGYCAHRAACDAFDLGVIEGVDAFVEKATEAKEGILNDV